MSKRFYYLLGFLIICSLGLSACSQAPSTSATKPIAPITTPASSPTPQASSGQATKAPPVTTQAATSPAAKSATPKYGGNLNIASRYAINNVGGAGDFAGSDQITFLNPITDRIFESDITGKLRPGLAESWDASVDGLTYTLRLKKGIKFQDGTDFNAEAVKYQFTYCTKLFPSVFANLASTDIVDPYTVKLTFKTFDANFFEQISQSSPGQICSPTALKIQSAPENITKNHLVGTGPFQFASWVRNNNIKYQKSTGYWQKDLPYLDSVQLTEFADPTTALMALKAGQIQMIDGVQPQDANGLKSAGFVIDMTDYSLVKYLVPDSANPDSPFANQKVREAVEWAIDRKAIAKSLGENYIEAASQLASSKDIAVYDTNMMKPREYNVQKAKELLASAGYPNGFKTSIIAQTIENKDFLVAVQAYLKAAGIDAEIQTVDPNKMAQLNKEGWKNGLLVYLQSHLSSSVSMQRFFSPPASATASFYYKSMLKAPEMVKLIDNSIIEPDYNKRIALMKNWQKYMYDNAIVTPIYTSWYMIAYSPKLHDLNYGKGFPTYFDWAHMWMGD